jgi:hypothetical protein
MTGTGSYGSSATGAILIELLLLKIYPIDDLIEFRIYFKAESPLFFAPRS